MAQADALYEELSAYENADFMATMYGLKGKHKKERIEEVFDLVQLSQHMKKQVQTFFRRDEEAFIISNSTPS